MRPDANDLMELARDLFQYLVRFHPDETTDSHRQKVVSAMVHIVPATTLQLVPHVTDTVIEQETLSLYSQK